jgi:hypothetical protein
VLFSSAFTSSAAAQNREEMRLFSSASAAGCKNFIFLWPKF